MRWFPARAAPASEPAEAWPGSPFPQDARAFARARAGAGEMGAPDGPDPVPRSTHDAEVCPERAHHRFHVSGPGPSAFSENKARRPAGRGAEFIVSVIFGQFGRPWRGPRSKDLHGEMESGAGLTAPHTRTGQLTRRPPCAPGIEAAGPYTVSFATGRARGPNGGLGARHLVRAAESCSPDPCLDEKFRRARCGRMPFTWGRQTRFNLAVGGGTGAEIRPADDPGLRHPCQGSAFLRRGVRGADPPWRPRRHDPRLQPQPVCAHPRQPRSVVLDAAPLGRRLAHRRKDRLAERAVACHVGGAGARLEAAGKADPHLLHMARAAGDGQHLVGEAGGFSSRNASSITSAGRRTSRSRRRRSSGRVTAS